MASSTLTSLDKPEIRQAYIDGGIALARAAADSYRSISKANADVEEARLILDGVVEGLEQLIKSWPDTVVVIAAATARMARR